MTYKLTNWPSIIRINDNACIPNDPDNTDYQAYLKWLEEGNKPLPADPVESSEPTPRQKLEAAGLTVDDLKSLLGL